MGDCEACSLGRVESFLKYHPHGSSRISKLENLRFLFDVPIAQWIRVGSYEDQGCRFESYLVYKIFLKKVF